MANGFKEPQQCLQRNVNNRFLVYSILSVATTFSLAGNSYCSSIVGIQNRKKILHGGSG